MNVADAVRLKLRAEASLAAAVYRDWQTYVLPGILLPFGVVYWIIPNDLIADSTPYIGRLDDVAVFAAILAICRLAVGTRRPDIQHATLAAASFVLGPLLFRLALGRWPTKAKLRLFQSAMRRNVAPVPPLLRGLAVMEEAKEQIGWLLQLSHVYGGTRSLIPHQLCVSAEPLRIPPHIGNPLCAWTGPDIAFLHFEKAAGTSFVHAFTQLFHPSQINPDPYRSMPPHLLSRFVSTGADASRYPFIWGHYDLPSIQRLGKNRLAYTILREPRARILSLYWYWRSVDPAVLRLEHGNETVWQAQKLDLLAFLRSDHEMLRDYIDNVYARRLTGSYAAGTNCDPLRTDPSRILDQALLALARMPVVGITERLTESLACLAGYIGLATPLTPPRANVTTDNSSRDRRFRVIDREPITTEIEAELVKLTRLDSALYSAAVNHLAIVGQRAGLPC